MADIKSKSQMKRISVQNPAKAAEVLQSLQEENARLRAQLTKAREALGYLKHQIEFYKDAGKEKIAWRKQLPMIEEALAVIGEKEGRDAKV